jgi:hypothetical protein
MVNREWNGPLDTHRGRPAAASRARRS